MVTTAGHWDLRTATLAAGAWLGAIGGWAIGWAALLGAGAAVAAEVVGRGRLRRHALLFGLAAVVGVVVATLGGAGREPPDRLAGAAAELSLRVTTDGRQLEAQPGRAAQLVVEARLDGARLGATTWQLDLPVRLVLPAADWRACGGCSPGARVTLHATIEPRAPTDPLLLVVAASVPVVVADAEGVAAATASARAGLRDAMRDQPPDAASLVSGLTLGDESGQDPAFAATMRVAGLSHLTAVSGGNIVVVLLLVLLPARSLGLPVAGQVAAGAAALAGYVLLVGPQPSVLRAGVMAAAGLAGVMLGGPARGAPILFGCTFLLLVVAPELALSLGFALSVAATAGLQLLAPPIARRLRRVVPPWLALAVAVTVAAQVTSAPILLAVGSPSSWVAVPANLAAVPLVAPITVLGLAVTVVAPVAPGAAAWLAGFATLPAQVLAVIAGLAEAADRSRWSGAVGTWLVALGVAGLAVAVARRTWPARWRPMAVAAVLVVMAVMVLAPWRGPGVPPDWRVVACDVGQGTAVLLRTRDGAVLVDTGPRAGGVGKCLADAEVERLDAVVLTHHHADHVGALAEVLDAVSVTALVVGPGEHPREGAAAVRAEAVRHALAPAVVAGGTRLEWDGLALDVLWPRPGTRGSADDVNNGSLVLVARWPDGASVLAPGDIEPESQAALQRTWQPPRVDLVVIPHHGSDHQDPGLAAWAAPLAAVASSGQGNSYGHPDASTITEYARLGTSVQRTDEDGSVAYSWRDSGLVVTRVG